MSGGIDPAARRRVGRGTIAVSALGIGGGSAFGRAGAQGDAMLAAAWDAGLRYFDTAALYLEGRSEAAFGAALSAHSRDDYVLSTKTGREGLRAFDYSAAGTERSVARSLERLRTDRLDLVMIHDVDPDMHGADFERRFDQAMAEAKPVLARLRDRGTIGAIGVGLKDWTVAERMLRTGGFDAVMLAGGYTLLQHGGLASLLPYCAAQGIGVIVAAPFNTGILATGAVAGARWYYEPAPPEILERTRQLEAACARHGIPLAAAALQFPLHHPAVAAVVAGHERPEEVTRNVALLRVPIPVEFWAELKDAGLLPAAAPVPS